MTMPRPLPSGLLRPTALALGALLLLSGCAHRGTTADAPPPQAERVETAAVEPSAATAQVETDAASTADVAARTAEASAGVATDTEAKPAPAEQPTVAGQAVAGDDARTQAERDFDALYGTQEPYDPVADPTLPPPAQQTAAYDPWEKFNRRMHRFNNAIDRRVAKPLANAYVKVVPRPVRLGVGNFFNNLGQPVSAVNALLQGKPKQAGQSFGRFLLNSTLGIGGIFDPATSAKLPNKSEDFGQTLGVWGWKKSRYLELPLFGPRTVRDVFGMVGDGPLSPTRQIEEDRIRVFLQGLQLVDLRAQLLSTDSFREGAADDYSLVRDAWMQRRHYQIFGDRNGAKDNELPDYLRDDDNPTVPVDAMPVQLPTNPQ